MTQAAPAQAQDAAKGRACVVELDGVRFSYGGEPVLEDVSLCVYEREFISIVGPNGGGKTTLLKLILGLLRPSAGAVRVFGAAPGRARPRIGYTPQHAQFDPRFPVSVLDVALMGCVEKSRWRGYRRQDRDAARQALDEVGLAEYAARAYADLSGGERQRVLVARALASRPELLLLDEPTANVDAAAETRMLEFLAELNARLTIMMVSHDLGFVSSIVRSVLCVNRRAVIHPTSEITGEIIQDIYGGDLRMVRHDHRCSEQGHEHGRIPPSAG